MIWVKSLKLHNFRLFSKYEVKFSEKINIIVGNNAVGKTTIVESIHCLGFAKSHRTNNDQQLIKIGQDFAIIRANMENNEKKSEIILGISDKGKKITLNNKTYNNLSDYIGFLNIVMFCPEDMEIVKGGPAIRRRFLDSNISQMNQLYLRSSINYKKILKDRNQLLKQMKETKKIDYNLLDVYTKGLIKEARNIIKIREKFINEINPYIIRKAKAITQGVEGVELRYIPSVNEENLEKTFKDNLKNDLFYSTTTKGPHRDDILIMLNKHNVAEYGSQGQQRTSVLAIKLALAELINKTNDNLIIILDDVFSELDLERQNEIINLLSNKNQIFITTTTIEDLTTEVLDNSMVIHINKECEENGEPRTKK